MVVNFNKDLLEYRGLFESSDNFADIPSLEDRFDDVTVLSPETAAEVDKKIEAARIMHDILNGVERRDIVKDFGASLENSD